MSPVRYYYRASFAKLSEKELEEVWDLTLDAGENITGSMRAEILRYKNYDDITIVNHIIIAKRGKESIGWGYLINDPWNRRFTRQHVATHVYVSRRERRKKVGTNIVKRLLKRYKTAKVYAEGWNKQAAGFYDNFKDRIDVGSYY